MNKTAEKLLTVLKKRQTERTNLKDRLAYAEAHFRRGQWKVNTANFAKILGVFCSRLSKMIEIDTELEQAIRELLEDGKEECRGE